MHTCTIERDTHTCIVYPCMHVAYIHKDVARLPQALYPLEVSLYLFHPTTTVFLTQVFNLIGALKGLI